MSLKYTTSFVRYAVLLFSLLTLSLGSAWGQDFVLGNYYILSTIEKDGGAKSDQHYNFDKKEYESIVNNNNLQRNNCKIEITLEANRNIAAGETGWGRLADANWNNIKEIPIFPDKNVKQGDLFIVGYTLDELDPIAQYKEKILIDIFDENVTDGVKGAASFIKVELVNPNNPFVGNFNSMPKTRTVSRSVSSVDLNVKNELQSSNSKYARFYLTDRKGNQVDPTGKLTVQYDGTNAPLCPIPEKGIYLLPDNGVDLATNMFYTWDGYGANATSEGSATEVSSHYGESLSENKVVIGVSSGSVPGSTYADLTGYTKMVFTGTPGLNLRVLMNRQSLGDDGEASTITKQFDLGGDGTYILDLTNVDNKGFVHLNSIKTGWGDNVGVVSSIKLIKHIFLPEQNNSGFDPSKISVQLRTPKEYKLYKVAALFSTNMNNAVWQGNALSREPDFDLSYIYSFGYNPKTKEKKDFVDWQDGVLAPNVVFSNPDKDWDTSWEELSLGYYMKWRVENESGKLVDLAENSAAQSNNWAINGSAVISGEQLINENVWNDFKNRTFYAPTGMNYENVNGYKIICEIYTNSTGSGDPNARYTFSLRNFLGELSDNNTDGTTMDIKKGVTSQTIDLDKVEYSDEVKYARIWLTTTDGTMVDPTGKLVISGMNKYVTGGITDVRFGYYLAKENISLSDISATLSLPLGTYNGYQVHVALSKDSPKIDSEGEITHEPDYDYVYTIGFTYPIKTKYKTIVLHPDSNNSPYCHVQPQLIQNWLELAADCGMGQTELAKNLYVRWYLTTDLKNYSEDKNNPVYLYLGNNAPFYSVGTENPNPEERNNYPSFFRYGGFETNAFTITTDKDTYNPKFNLPNGYRYDDCYKVRLVCLVTTKVGNKTYNNNAYAEGEWPGDPEEIQVRYVYTIKTESQINAMTFAHYEGEAYRYLNEIGNDATDYDYLTYDKDKNIGTNTAPTWNSETNEYNTGERSVRQNVHTVHYYYYVDPNSSTQKSLFLPLQNYNDVGQVTEPRAYFRWYNYKTDRKAGDYLEKSSDTRTNQWGTSIQTELQEIGDWGLFGKRINGDPCQIRIGVDFTPNKADFTNESNEILIACDVSRYMDGMDESFTYLIHEPTISIRYLFHIMPASEIATKIERSESLTAVEKQIMGGEKPTILEDEGRTVVSTNNGYGEFALRTQLNDLGQYYIKTDNTYTPAQSLWWYAYYKDEEGNWWKHLIPNKQYRDRDGNSTAIYRTQSHQAKYSLIPIWEEDGDFSGTWESLQNNSTKTADIKVGDRVQMVACVSTGAGGQNATGPTGTIMPIIWTELEFIDAKPMELGKEDSKRTEAYMTTEYVPADTLDFNNFSLFGNRKPEHSYQNYATVPLQYPNAQYGYIYPQLYGYCGTMKAHNWGGFGLAPLHGDYTLLKSMNMPRISMDLDLDVGKTDQSIMVNWVNENREVPLFDVTHERASGKIITESEDYGGFLYVDAADEARTIATLEFDATLCTDAKIYYTAYVASMTGSNTPADGNAVSPQTAPTLRFRVSVFNEVPNDYVPVITFVTGNIRQEVQMSGSDNGKFKEAQWYQVYGYTTIPEEIGLYLNKTEGNHFRVEIDNYCDNTDGADYCVDQIMFYTNSASLKVKQDLKVKCDEQGMSLNIYMEKEEMEKLHLWNPYPDRTLYWRICDEDGKPLTDKTLYGDFLANGAELEQDNNKVPYAKTEVGEAPEEFQDKPQEGEGTYGYFKQQDDNGEDVYCFSLANMYFNLPEGKRYSISVNTGDPSSNENWDNLWGTPDDICSTFSHIFVPKALYLSVSDIDGNVNPEIEVTCSDHVAHLANFNMVLNVPEENGFTKKENIAFDYFVGTKENLDNYIATLDDKTYKLEAAIAHYRARGYGYSDNDKSTKIKTFWDYDQAGLDAEYEKVCNGETGYVRPEGEDIKGYYAVLKKAVDEGVLYLECSPEFSLPIDVSHATILAFAIEEKVTNSNGLEFDICSPMALTFKVNDKLYDPMAVLGFEDIDYPEGSTRAIRVGMEQLNNMQYDFMLHIPVNSFKTRTQESEDGNTQEKALNVVGQLELLAYDTTIDVPFANEDDEEATQIEKTNDPDVKANFNVATFSPIGTGEQGAVIKDGQMYVAVKFKKDNIKNGDNTFQGFKEGFTYRMFFRVKKANGGVKDCEANVEFLMKVVPEYVTWNDGEVTGNENQNTNWNNDANWSRSKKAELYSGTYVDNTGDTPATFVPMKFTYVTIPSDNVAPNLVNLTTDNNGIYNNIGSDATPNIQYDLMVRYTEKTCQDHSISGNVYDCEKFYGNWAKEIYFKPRAELVNQHYLTYEKVWVEKELTAGKWTLMSTPLQNTYAGDMYVPVGGRQETEAFQKIEFDINKGYSRTLYPIYQRSWGMKDGKVYTKTNDVRGTDYSALLNFQTVGTTFAEWSHTFNDVQVPYSTRMGFAIRAHKSDYSKKPTTLALLRLPKKDTEYDYYLWDNTSPTDGEVSKPTTGKLFTDNTPDIDGLTYGVEYIKADKNKQDPTTKTDAVVEVPVSDLQEVDGYLLVGNPYLCSIKMSDFFKENAFLTGGSWLYDDNEQVTDPTEIKPLQSFFVKLANKDNTTEKITFTAGMMKGNETSTTQPAPAMRMTAANGRGQSMATVSLGEETKSVETLFDSNLEDVPMVYTVADGQAVSIHQLTDLDKPIAFGVTCVASNELVEVMFTDVAQLTNGNVCVVDAVTGAQTTVGEGSVVAIQPNDYGRYFLLAGMTTIVDRVDVQKGIIISVRDREVTVTSGEELTQVHALSLTGATVYQDAARSTTASFSLSSGVYIIKAENKAGEQQTVKVIVR